MHELTTLIGYEYKKIVQRKSTWITLILATLITLISCFSLLTGKVYVEGKPVYSHYTEMMTNRAYDRALSGRPINFDLIKEMQNAYQLVPEGQLWSATPEYQQYAKPYESIYFLVYDISKDVKNFNPNKFYDIRNELILKKLNNRSLSDTEIQKHLELNSKFETPIIYSYTKGYTEVISLFYSLGLTLTMVIAICLAPVFANEHQTRADQIILSSKHGKNSGILAKLLTGISFGVMSAVILLVLQILPTLSIYGFDGWNASIQLFYMTATYPMTMLQGILILCALVIACSVLISSFSLFLSALLKSASGVIIIVSTLSILIMIYQAPEHNRFLSQLFELLPANVMSAGSLFCSYFYVILGKCFTTFQVVPIIYPLISIIFLFISYRSFKNHQIG